MAVAQVEQPVARTASWASFEAMKKAGAPIEQDPATFDWYRTVQKHTGASEIHSGELVHELVSERRSVALSLIAARQTRSDYWNGSSWVRNGVKNEVEARENLGAAATRASGATTWVKASPADQAAAQQQAARQAARTAVIPSVPARGEGET